MLEYILQFEAEVKMYLLHSRRYDRDCIRSRFVADVGPQIWCFAST